MARPRSSAAQETPPTTRSDAYVGLLFISLLAQITGAVFFFLDWQQYPTTKPPEPAKITAPAAGPGAPAGGAAVVPAGGAAVVPAGGAVK